MKIKNDKITNRAITYTLTQTLNKSELKAVSGASATVKATGGGGTGGAQVDCIVDI
jgi:hypothetical protein